MLLRFFVVYSINLRYNGSIKLPTKATGNSRSGIGHYLIPGGEFPGIIEIFKTKISDVGFFTFSTRK